MKKVILVAGATGNLGGRIVRDLVEKGASVRAIVRLNSNGEKIAQLERLGVEVLQIDMTNVDEIAKACQGVSCVVSALQGLRDVIVDAQKALLDGAIQAGVPRFIPSDYSTDYTKLVAGENRNFDLRREFNAYFDNKAIAATSIFNGAFSEILTYGTPLLDPKKKSVAYWGDKADWKMDFTTMDDTAAFTAAAALDNETPRYLRIASFQISPNEIRSEVKQATNEDFAFFQIANLEQFKEGLKKQRADNPEGENQIYSKWQSGQYMYGMMTTQHESLDNARYPALQWTSGQAFIKSIV